MRAAPRRGIVDLRVCVDQAEGLREVFGEDCHGVAGCEELEGAGEADYAGAGNGVSRSGIGGLGTFGICCQVFLTQ